MKIIVASLLCAFIAYANFIGGRTQVDPTHLGSTVFNGKAAYRPEHKYIASLQLNGSHICSSGMFQMGFLLTTVECAWHLGMAIKRGEQKATAVFAHPILEDGHRINIFKIAYCISFLNYEDDVGVAMLVNNYDDTYMAILHLYPTKIHLRKGGPEASVCGWATDNPLDNYNSKDATFSGHLHCMSIRLYGEALCYKNIPFGDYKRKLLCGRSDGAKQILSKKYLGSPVTKFVYDGDLDENFILGVTIRPHVHGDVTFHRFIRINLVFDDIQAMVKELESKTEADEADAACVGKYFDPIEESDERSEY